MNAELEIISKGNGHGLIEALPQNMLGRNEENEQKLKSS
jgi:hypothetical protein